MLPPFPEGIYYRKNPPIGNSFCIISLRSEKSSNEEIGVTVAAIWNRITKLKKGITEEFQTDLKHRKIGNLSALLAYGSKVFNVTGLKKNKPRNFSDIWNFVAPKKDGGGPVLQGSGMSYSTNVFENHLLDDHLIFQFIADSEFYTNRAVIEVSRELRRMQKEFGNETLHITGFYSGFQRADNRNWLGFHDGVSNLRSHERPQVIFINSRYLDAQDKWTTNGTYLAFMRIGIDLPQWDDTRTTLQEMIIGRDKVTGCPIEIDCNGMPVKIRGCPIPSTSEIIDVGNERFRDRPPYSNKTLRKSHIGSTRSIDRVPVWDTKSFRIYRQGFEFLTSSKYPFMLTPGLNFVSFQNSPERLFRALTYGSTLFKKDLKFATPPGLNAFLSVHVAGIFLVPPLLKGELFPGAQIFGTKNVKKY